MILTFKTQDATVMEGIACLLTPKLQELRQLAALQLHFNSITKERCLSIMLLGRDAQTIARIVRFHLWAFKFYLIKSPTELKEVYYMRLADNKIPK